MKWLLTDSVQFLRFFKLALKFLFFASIVALAIILPVHNQNPTVVKRPGKNQTRDDDDYILGSIASRDLYSSWNSTVPEIPWPYQTDYLWMYLIFTYIFTGVVAFLLVKETREIIEVRQEYLGNQSTITDRTIFLSGIPLELRSEEKIKDFVEELRIGKVESVTLCRNWAKLDKLMVDRHNLIRRLEEYWTVYLGGKPVEPSPETLPIVQPPPPRQPVDYADDENSHLLDTEPGEHPRTAGSAYDRPKANIRFGRFNLRSMELDAIDYYEEKMKRQDERITTAREKEYEPVPMAFVTMDSVASCVSGPYADEDTFCLYALANGCTSRS